MPGPSFWIDSHLGLRQQETLFGWLLERATNPSAKLIRKGIIELFPHKQAPSRPACNRWKKARWHMVLLRRRIQASADAAKKVVPEDADAIDKANRVALQVYIFEILQLAQEGKLGEITTAMILELARCSTSLSRNGRESRESESRLLDAKRKRKAEDEAKAKANRKLTDEEKAAEMNRIFGIEN